jgi:SAM-dependent methyltransferase
MREAHQSFEFVLNVRTQYVGHVTFPCVPAAAGMYLLRLDDMFRLMGRALNSDERRQLAETLENHLRMGYARAGDANLRIDYEMHPDRSLHRNLAIRMTLSTPDLATQFKNWNSGDGDHPFGKHPDARVTAVVRTLPVPTRVLEIGGGTGRNALPIARLGHPVEVVELTEEFSRAMIRRAEMEGLPLQVRWGNVLDESIELPAGHYGLMFASEVVSHFRFDGSLRRFLERGARALQPGGCCCSTSFCRCPGRDTSRTHWPGRSPNWRGPPCFRGRI